MRLADMAKEDGKGRRDVFWLNPDRLEIVPGFNLRGERKDLDDYVRWLADSIKEKGVLQPLTIRNPKTTGGLLQITDGECRLRAVALAKSEGADIKAVPVQVEEDHASEADRVLGMLLRNSILPLTPVEKSRGFKRLAAWGWSEKQMAKESGYSLSQVANFLRLSGLDPELTKAIEEGKISATEVVKEVQTQGKEQAKRNVKAAVEKAEASGKRKATRKDIPKPPKDKPMFKRWEVWGPKFKRVLENIVSVNVSKAGPYIATARELLEEFDQE